jgi:hypothetical protein
VIGFFNLILKDFFKNCESLALASLAVLHSQYSHVNFYNELIRIFKLF